jgi:hypothetical protein
MHACLRTEQGAPLLAAVCSLHGFVRLPLPKLLRVLLLLLLVQMEKSRRDEQGGMVKSSMHSALLSTIGCSCA